MTPHSPRNMAAILNQPWFAQDVASILGVNDLDKHLKKILPKFDTKKSGTLNDHIKKIMLEVKLMTV